MRKATVIKMRDGEAGETFAYRLPTVQIGVDEDGDPLGDMHQATVHRTESDEDWLTSAKREIMDAMRTAREGDGDRVRVKEVRLRFYAGRPDAKPDANLKAFNRALSAATSAGRVIVDEAEEWVSPK